MRATILTAALALLAGTAAAGDATGPWRIVHLNSPGAMEKLRISNPEHYRKIVGVFGVTQGGPHGLMEVRSRELKSIGTGMLLLTYPPQRDFRVTLDNTTYMGRATVDMTGFRPMMLEYRTR
jgi:hypothetical protein